MMQYLDLMYSSTTQIQLLNHTIYTAWSVKKFTSTTLSLASLKLHSLRCTILQQTFIEVECKLPFFPYRL